MSIFVFKRLRRLHAGLSPRRPGFDPRTVCVSVLWLTKWSCDRFSLQYFCFPLSVSFHRCSIPVFIYTLLLTKGQRHESWEPPKEQCPVGSRGVLRKKVLPLVVWFVRHCRMWLCTVDSWVVSVLSPYRSWFLETNSRFVRVWYSGN